MFNKVLAGVAFSTIGLSACDNPTPPTAPPPPATLETIAAPVAAPPLTKADAVARIATGQPFRIVLDTCAVPDDGWTGVNDPLGTIKCGETYTLMLDVAAGKFSATGMNEENGSVMTLNGDGGLPAEGLVSIWGAEFSLGDGGVVKTPAGEAVGHFKLD